MNEIAKLEQRNTVATHNAGTEVETQRAIAEVQASMAIAKRFPRDVLDAIDRIKNVCQRPALAQNATYTYARGGSNVTGPSIRLAEAIAQNWGNMQYGIRELEQRNGESTVEAFAWDVETNTRSVKQFQVRHWRDTKSGGYALKDSRDIYEKVANDGARRLRACILAVIPADVVETAVDECERTLKANVEITKESIAKMLEAFKALGVDKSMIENRIQRKMESIQPAQFLNLRKIYTSINDGMSGPEEWFDMGKEPEEAKGNAGVKEALKAKAKKDESANDTAPSGALPEPDTAEYEAMSRQADLDAAAESEA